MAEDEQGTGSHNRIQDSQQKPGGSKHSGGHLIPLAVRQMPWLGLGMDRLPVELLQPEQVPVLLDWQIRHYNCAFAKEIPQCKFILLKMKVDLQITPSSLAPLVVFHSTNVLKDKIFCTADMVLDEI